MPYFEQWCPKYFRRITSYKAKITYCPTKENMQCALEPYINIPCPFNITEWKPSLRKRLATFCNSSKNIFINKSGYWLTPIVLSCQLTIHNYGCKCHFPNLSWYFRNQIQKNHDILGFVQTTSHLSTNINGLEPQSQPF